MQHGVQGGWGKWVIRIGALSSIVVLGGCAVNPHPVDKQELANIVHRDHDAALAGMPGLAAPLNLDEAIARALKYNLDHRSRMLEQALAAWHLDVSRLNKQPQQQTNTRNHYRDEENIRRATDSVT